MTAEVLHTAHDGGVTTLTLHRPAALNALDAGLTTALTDALARADADDEVGAIVLTGAGRGFCAGADLGELAATLDAESGHRPSAAALHAVIREGSLPLAHQLLALRTPLVAAVHGPCAGAGMALALAADVVLAAPNARFTVAFVRRGLVPDYGVTWLLPRLVGLRTARELCLLGEPFDADAAQRMGLVTRLVAADALAAEADRVAAALAAGPRTAQRLTKQLLAGSDQLDAASAADAEFAAQTICLASDDAAEGAKAFLEHREPRFTGH